MSRYALTLALAATLSLPVGADFNSAVTAYENKQLEAAYNEFRRLAELGDAPSQRNLAAMYARGEQVAANAVEAWAWAALAAEQDPTDSTTLRDALVRKLSPEQREAGQQRLHELQLSFGKAALTERLLPVAADRAADCSVEVSGDATPVKTVQPQYPEAAARDGFEGYVCASFYIKGDGTPASIHIYDAVAYQHGRKDQSRRSDAFRSTSLRALEKWKFVPAATAALREVPRKYCMDYQLDGMTRKEWEEKKATFDQQREAALAGDPQAQYQLAAATESRIPALRLSSTQRSELSNTVRQLFAHSALGGHAAGQFRLAKDLLTGNQCEKDISKGITWLTFAAQQGHSESQYLLASRLMHGEGVERSTDKAVQWLRAAADGDHSRAKIDYALYLLRHEPSRRSEAMRYLPDSPKPNDLAELEAAALNNALAGAFEQAVAYQKEVVAIATAIEAPLQQRVEALTRYQVGQIPDLLGIIN